MEKIKTVKDVEFAIRRAVWVDKRLPKPGPREYQCPIGKWKSSEEVMMSLDDRHAESQIDRVLSQDVDDWWVVMNEWLVDIPLHKKEVILKRCGNMGWKRLAFEVHAGKRTVQRWFKESSGSILEKIINKNA